MICYCFQDKTVIRYLGPHFTILLKITTHDVLVNSPNRAPCFLYKQYGRIWLFNSHSLFYLINSKSLIISYTILFELCKERLDVDKLPGAERVKAQVQGRVNTGMQK